MIFLYCNSAAIARTQPHATAFYLSLQCFVPDIHATASKFLGWFYGCDLK